MKQTTYFSVFFFILLGFNLLGNFYSTYMIANIAKVMLMPVLAGVFLTAAYSYEDSKLKRWIFFALLFSWGGDILLIFQDINTNFFLLGLASFLLAHLCYIFAYRNARDTINAKGRWRYWAILIIILGFYLFFLFIKIGLGLGSFLIPVIVYAVTISAMLLTSFSRIDRTTRTSFLYVVSGSTLFVLSDSLIALNKFSFPIVNSGVWIMLTYGTAQYLIIRGVIEHHRGLK